MKALKFAMVLSALLLTAGLLWAAPQYGEAIVEQGSMTIVREGQTLKFDKVKESVPVNEEDLIRVRADSLVQLKSRENATITLGANAVFQVKPWQAQGKSGFLRALFGRFRSVVVGLSGGEQFNVKTATATIGVKGTENHNQVTSRGGLVSIGVENTTYVLGQTGGEREVPPGFVSLGLNFQPPTAPAPLPPGFANLLNAQNLGSPSPNSPAGQNFVGEELLIAAGIVTRLDLDANKGHGGGEETGPDKRKVELPRINANAAPQRARVPIGFQ